MITDSVSPGEGAAFQVRQCTRPTCGLRFSIMLADPRGNRCPVCRAPTQGIAAPANDRAPSSTGGAASAAAYGRAVVGSAVGQPTGPALEVLLDNIRSAWNVGSMLRSADGAGVRRVHLCGVSAAPDNPKVSKTALGAEKSLPWTFYPDGVAAARSLKEQGLRLWALEGGERAVSLFDPLPPGDRPHAPVVLVVGNELSGVDPGILELCERVVCLPMQGIKDSLNVAVAFGVAVYTIRFGLRMS